MVKGQPKKALEIISQIIVEQETAFLLQLYMQLDVVILVLPNKGLRITIILSRKVINYDLSYHNSNRDGNCCDDGAVRPMVQDKEA